MTIRPSQLTVSAGTAGGASLLHALGTLDSSTYLQLRDRVIKAALEEPPAVLVDISDLEVPTQSAWSVFTSARWHVSIWPDIPVLLVCPRPDVAARIARTGVTPTVPVHVDVESALASLVDGKAPRRRRVRIELPYRLSSLRGSRDFVAEWLSIWSQDQLIPTAKVIVDVLVENVLRHTESPPVVLLESTDSVVTIAVQDADDAPAVRHEAAGGADQKSGLAVVGALCRAWGNSPTPSGKTVWAVVGPENRL